MNTSNNIGANQGINPFGKKSLQSSPQSSPQKRPRSGKEYSSNTKDIAKPNESDNHRLEGLDSFLGINTMRRGQSALSKLKIRSENSGPSLMASSISRFNQMALPPSLQGAGGCPGSSTSAEGSCGDPEIADSPVQHPYPIEKENCTPPGTPTRPALAEASSVPGTPPSTPTRQKSSQPVGTCKGVGSVQDGYYFKLAYKEPPLDVRSTTQKKSYFRQTANNALLELIMMNKINSFLQETPISIKVQGEPYTVHVVPTELTDLFEFKQPNIEKDSMALELKKEMSGEILKAMLPQLWDAGFITALDIKPDNFHVSGNEIHIFDLYFPKGLFDSSEDLKIQIHSHCNTDTMLTKDVYESLTTELFENHFNLDAARKLAKDSKAECDKLIKTHEEGLKCYYESLLESRIHPAIPVPEYGFLDHLEEEFSEKKQ